MARGKQLTQLVSELRAELERSTEISVGVTDIPNLQQVIKRQYETLYLAYDWPHRRKVFDRIQLNAGQRTYDFPDDLDFDRIEDVAIWYNGSPMPAERGIGFAEFAAFDSESDERSDPVQKWDVRADANTAVFEVWPLPASEHHIQFIGITAPPPFVADNAVCVLDDNLILLYAKAELLPKGSEIRNQTLAAARECFAQLKSRSKSGDTERYRLGLGGPQAKPYRRATVTVRG